MNDRGDQAGRVRKEDLVRIILMAAVIIAVAVFWIWDCIHTGKIVWGMGFVILVLLIILYLNIRAMLNRKQSTDMQKELQAYDSLDERIRLLQDYRRQGKFDDQINTYHNLMSLCYYEAGSFDMALEENLLEREAIKRQLDGKTVFSGQPYLVNHANQATFLLAANRFDEAEKCIVVVEEELKTLEQKKSYAQYAASFRRGVLTPHLAKLALVHKDPQAARSFIEQLEKIENKRDDERYLIKLLWAEYEQQTGNTAAAVAQLDDILANPKTGILTAQAQKLKDAIQASNSGSTEPERQ